MRLISKIGIFLLLCLVGVEVGLRLYGLGEWITYEESQEYEYRITPNLRVSRFHHTITTNSLGMRATPEPQKSKKKVLKIGDSVINGGSKVDDQEVATALLQKEINKIRLDVDLFNISAGSWGPDNAYEYVKKEINFEYDAIVLVFSSHDFNDNMHHNSVVNWHPSWPGEQPICAIYDLWYKLLKGKLATIFNIDVKYDRHLIGHDNTMMNPGWENFFNLAADKKIPFVVYIHPNQGELNTGNWSEQGMKLIHWLEKNEVNYIDGLIKGYDQGSYIDNIHLNAIGHKSLAKNLSEKVIEICKNI